MRPQALRRVLRGVRARRLSVASGMEALRDLPYEDLGFAKVDHHRELRLGAPEVVYGPGKRPDDLVRIARAIASRGQALLATRLSPDGISALLEALPRAMHHERARAVSLPGRPQPRTGGRVAVLCAGTADIPVAEEAGITAALMGCRADPHYDVGVAGLHRLLSKAAAIRKADALVVVAGMEGALPSVVGGLVGRPLIAVPTSVGYGASFGGVAPLLAMMNSCAPGVAVVNIDNGFGAGYLAAMIARATRQGGR